MVSVARTDPRSTANTTSTLVLLLAIAIFINALDRGNFSTAAPLIKDELSLPIPRSAC